MSSDRDLAEQIALESPAAVDDGFAVATIWWSAFLSQYQGHFVDQWIAKIIDMEKSDALSSPVNRINAVACCWMTSVGQVTGSP